MTDYKAGADALNGDSGNDIAGMSAGKAGGENLRPFLFALT